MLERIRCHHYGDVLEDAPPSVDTCKKWCVWQTREHVATLAEVEAIRLQMLAFFLGWKWRSRRVWRSFPNWTDASIATAGRRVETPDCAYYSVHNPAGWRVEVLQYK
jgi:hypothetical protein